MFTFEFSYCSIISGSLQSSSSDQSGTFFIALCKIIRSLSNRLLFEYLTWFCFFSLGLITQKNKDFARSRAAVKRLRWASSSWALFSRDLISRWSWLILALCSGCFSFIELFWKNSSYVSGVSVCIFVALYLCNFVSLYVGMFVARANKVEGTMSWCLGTNEILAST